MKPLKTEEEEDGVIEFQQQVKKAKDLSFNTIPPTNPEFTYAWSVMEYGIETGGVRRRRDRRRAQGRRGRQARLLGLRPIL